MTYILELQIKWQTLSNYYINSFLQQHVQKVCFCTPLPKLGFTKLVDRSCGFSVPGPQNLRNLELERPGRIDILLLPAVETWSTRPSEVRLLPTLAANFSLSLLLQVLTGRGVEKRELGARQSQVWIPLISRVILVSTQASGPGALGSVAGVVVKSIGPGPSYDWIQGPSLTSCVDTGQVIPRPCTPMPSESVKYDSWSLPHRLVIKLSKWIYNALRTLPRCISI